MIGKGRTCLWPLPNNLPCSLHLPPRNATIFHSLPAGLFVLPSPPPLFNPGLISMFTLLVLLFPAFQVPETDGAAKAPSFLREVMPILTRNGCNQGGCHGKGVGQNGFRLSLRGYAPELDHEWITREFSGRRVSGTQPSDSPLLRKVSGQSPHEGGKLLDTGSRGYKVLENWLAMGMPGPDKAEPVLDRLEVTPEAWEGSGKESRNLRVLAVWSNGEKTDITWLARFQSNTPAVATVTPEGLVHLEGQGETAIQVSFLQQVAVATVRFPFPRSSPTTAGKPNSGHPIDAAIARQLSALNIPVSPLADDATWFRRIHLDLTGRLPTPEKILAFENDKNPGKYAQLTTELLKTCEFTDIWTLFLTELLQNRKERDHDVRALRGVRSFHSWLRREVVEGTRWDALTRRILLASGSVSEDPAVGYWIVGIGEARPVDSEMPGMISQAFLGTRVGCAQCHNHPTEKFTQEDYLRQAGFLSRLKLDRKGPRQGETSLLPVADLTAKTGVNHPRNGQFLEPRPLDRSPTHLDSQQDPRLPFVSWLTRPDNPLFARAMANRIWRHMMGRGLVEPVDDLRVTNPPSNPELLSLLELELVRAGFDYRHLIRFIASSEAYRRSSATLPANQLDDRYNSHFLARRLPAEVLLDVIDQATGVPESFPGYPKGTRAIQLADPGIPNRFLTTFGRSERVTACACEKSGDVTLPQVLHLLNGDRIQEKINHPDGVLAKVVKNGRPPLDQAEYLHLFCLGKPLDPAGKSAVQRAFADPGARGDEVLADLFWALLNAKEFSFQH